MLYTHSEGAWTPKLRKRNFQFGEVLTAITLLKTWPHHIHTPTLHFFLITQTLSPHSTPFCSYHSLSLSSWILSIQKSEKENSPENKKMSVASSIPCIKIPTSASSSCSSSSSYHYGFSASKPGVFTIRSSQTEGPLRRPAAPMREPARPTLPLEKPIPPSPSPTSSPPPPPPPPSASLDKNVITLEFQRQVAKELQDYFKQKKLEDANQGPFFGFLGKNEIANGRYIYVYGVFLSQISLILTSLSFLGFKNLNNLTDPYDYNSCQFFHETLNPLGIANSWPFFSVKTIRFRKAEFICQNLNKLNGHSEYNPFEKNPFSHLNGLIN